MLTLRGGGAQVAIMNMLYLLASVAQLLALRVLVVILSLWVLENQCYPGTRVRSLWVPLVGQNGLLRPRNTGPSSSRNKPFCGPTPT